MSVSFPGHDPFPAYEDDHDTAEIIMNNYQLTGVYALKPPGAAGFPSAFEMSIVDYEDMPENMRRSWGVFSLGHLKGFVKLEKVEADLRGRRSISPSPEMDRGGAAEEDNAGPKEGDDNNKPKEKEIVVMPDIWVHDFHIGDVLVFKWRGAVHEHRTLVQKFWDSMSPTGNDDSTSTSSNNPSEQSGRTSPVPLPKPIFSGLGFVQPPRVIPWIGGECRVTLRDYNNIDVLWKREGEKDLFYEGQRIIGRVHEVRFKRPAELKDGHQYTLEDYLFR